MTERLAGRRAALGALGMGITGMGTSLKKTCLFAGMALLTFSGSRWAWANGAQRALEYASYGILLPSVACEFLMDRGHGGKGRVLRTFLAVMALFSVGLLCQEEAVPGLPSLLATMAAIAIPALLSGHYLDSPGMIRAASDAVLCGVLLSLLAALLAGIPVVVTGEEQRIEGMLGIPLALEGGILYKNYFGADMCVVFVGHYLCGRLGRRTASDRLAMLLSLALVLLSNSRGSVVLLLVFLACIWLGGLLRRVHCGQRWPLAAVALLLVVLAAACLFRGLALGSQNYMVRLHGLVNYLSSEGMDARKMLLGISGSLYGKEEGYRMTFRQTYGLDGSVDMALLNILLKNGFLGLLGYAAIFAGYTKAAFGSRSWEYGAPLLAVAAMLLASSLVETYMQSIHSPVGTFCYLVMGGLAGMCGEDAQGRRGDARGGGGR